MWGNVRAQAKVFGSFDLMLPDGTSIIPASRRARMITAYLLLSPRHEATRDRLAGLLWGDRGEQQARSSLRQCLFEIRKSTGPAGVDLLDIGRDTIRLRGDTVDVNDAWYKAAEITGEALPQAIAWLTVHRDARLLEDLELSGAFDDWLAQTRASVERTLAARVRTLLDHCKVTGDTVSGLSLADAWLVRDPLDEAVVATAIRFAQSIGATADAHRRFAVLRQALKDELGVEPSPVVEAALHGNTPTSPASNAAAGPGSSAPVASVHEQKAAPIRPPLQAHLTLARRWPLVGRSAEQGILFEAWQSASNGLGGVVLLSGEAGIGKTEIAVDFTRGAHEAGAIVLFGYSNEHIQTPYRPVAAALDHFAAYAPAAALQRHVAVHGGALAAILPALRRQHPDAVAVPQGDGGGDRLALFDAVSDLLAAAAELAPLVLMLDDLHWASVSDLQLVGHLVRGVAAHRMMIVATVRDSEIGSNQALTALLADWRRNPSVVRLPLKGLDEPAVADLVEAAGLTTTKAMSVSWLCRGTAGNPFFIGELISEWGHLAQGSASEIAATDIVPDSIRDVVEQRIARLHPNTITLLGLAAVVGQHFELSLITEVMGEAMSGETLILAIEDAASAGLIEDIEADAGRYRFRHGILQTALYQSLSSARRRRLHRQVAEALELRRAVRRSVSVDALAYHWTAASTHDDNGKAIEYLTLAGDEAAAAFAFEAAIASFTHALAMLEANDRSDDKRRCELFLRLGTAQRASGDIAFRATMAKAAESARVIGDAVCLAHAALGSGQANGAQWGNGIDGDLVARYDEALLAIGKANPALRVRLKSQLAAELRYDPDDARRTALTAEAIAQAREIGNPHVLAAALIARNLVIENPFTLAERLELTQELEAIAATIGNPQLTTHAAQLRCTVLLQSGDMKEAEQALDRCERAAAAQRTPIYRLFPQTMNTILALMRGDADAQTRVGALFAASSAIGLPMAANIFAAQTFDVVSRQNQAGMLVDQIRQVIAHYPYVTTFRIVLPYTLAEVGRFDEARALMDDFAATDFDIPRNLNWASAVFLLSEVAAALDDPRPARTYYDIVAQVAEQIALAAGVKSYGSMAHAAGLFAALLGRHDEADRYLRTSIATNDRIGAAPAAVASRRALATHLIAHGDADAARPLIAAARQTALQLDLVAERVKLDKLEARLAVCSTAL